MLSDIAAEGDLLEYVAAVELSVILDRRGVLGRAHWFDASTGRRVETAP